jgi:hypothetical protein
MGESRRHTILCASTGCFRDYFTLPVSVISQALVGRSGILSAPIGQLVALAATFTIIRACATETRPVGGKGVGTHPLSVV